jgi:hypothetical protein
MMLGSWSTATTDDPPSAFFHAQICTPTAGFIPGTTAERPGAQPDPRTEPHCPIRELLRGVLDELGHDDVPAVVERLDSLLG